MVREFGKVFTIVFFFFFFANGRAFSKDKTLQDFKGSISTLLLLILNLSVTFSCYEQLGQIFNGIKFKTSASKK